MHLAPFIDEEGPSLASPGLEDAMDAVRTLATSGSAAREDASQKTGNTLVRKVRQPLARVVCVVKAAEVEQVRELLPLLESELNVKRAELATSADSLVTLEAKPNFRTLGKKFGKGRRSSPPRRCARSARDVLRRLRARRAARAERRRPGAHARRRRPDDRQARVGGAGGERARGLFRGDRRDDHPGVAAEGLARETVSAVQRLRKDAGLAVSDRIRSPSTGARKSWTAVRAHRD